MNNQDPPNSQRLSGASRVWILTAGITAAAVGLAALVASWSPLGGPFDLPWWAIAIGVYITELTVVHLRFRRDAHTVSMSELALVTGLFLASPIHLIIGQAIGNFAALTLNRKQSVLKLAFNVSQFTLVAGLEVVVFRAIARSGNPVEVLSWIGAIAATLVGMLVSNAAINAAIRLVGGHLNSKEITEVLALSTVASILNTGLALVGVAVLWEAPQAFVLAMVPPVSLFVAYRAYVSQRQERARLESLYRATRMLHESPQIEEALTAAVKHGHAMFEADLVEISIFAPHENTVYLTTLASGHLTAVMEAGTLEEVDDMWREFSERPMAFVMKTQKGARSMGGRPLADAVIAPLHLSDGVSGLLMAANRLGDIDTFDETDVKLLETLARQVSVSLENGRLEDSLAALTDLKEQMRHRANHDSLTQLANRSLFIESLASELDAETPGQLAVLFLDLDDFKAVNDTYGHATGDGLLVAVAQRLMAVSRESDLVARFGGDEFAILLSKRNSQAEALAVRIHNELSAPLAIGSQSITARVSIGIAFAGIGYTTERVLREADAAMYAAKRSGKSSYRVFEPGMRVEPTGNLKLRTELAEAIRADQIDLVYQPIVSFQTGEITGVEALARWYHPERGVILPANFIPLAEQTGLINELGLSVLARAMHQARSWSDRFPHHTLKMSVNLSPIQLVDDRLVTDVSNLVIETGLDATTLVLEITENVLMHTSTRTLDRIKELGVMLAIDDFGTGYSSLSYLDRLPIDIVKVDKSFVDRLETGDSPLVRTVLQIGEALGVETVVEGVESARQISILQTIGCDQGQGFYFAAPMPPAEFEEIMAARLDVSSNRKASPHLRLVG